MKRDISVVGIDIAKRVFHLVGMDERGKIVLRKRCSLGEVLPWLAHIPTDLVVAQEASDVESSSRLDFLLPHNLRRHFIA